ncbi:hypothetical protein Rhopal_006069-T1 [Rhodotorula paludigena]|uniref:Uncharacterized protein n=1 Tax=Rhodotorula paludigena TaxID=86838 RepID=A0AAV5GR64_9BASI|nr:hypothetical protein Rhopal_006069-T1 [Rhodotorula paludigena]
MHAGGTVGSPATYDEPSPTPSAPTSRPSSPASSKASSSPFSIRSSRLLSTLQPLPALQPLAALHSSENGPRASPLPDLFAASEYAQRAEGETLFGPPPRSPLAPSSTAIPRAPPPELEQEEVARRRLREKYALGREQEERWERVVRKAWGGEAPDSPGAQSQSSYSSQQRYRSHAKAHFAAATTTPLDSPLVRSTAPPSPYSGAYRSRAPSLHFSSPPRSPGGAYGSSVRTGSPGVSPSASPPPSAARPPADRTLTPMPSPPPDVPPSAFPNASHTRPALFRTLGWDYLPSRSAVRSLRGPTVDGELSDLEREWVERSRRVPDDGGLHDWWGNPVETRGSWGRAVLSPIVTETEPSHSSPALSDESDGATWRRSEMDTAQASSSLSDTSRLGTSSRSQLWDSQGGASAPPRSDGTLQSLTHNPASNDVSKFASPGRSMREGSKPHQYDSSATIGDSSVFPPGSPMYSPEMFASPARNEFVPYAQSSPTRTSGFQSPSNGLVSVSDGTTAEQPISYVSAVEVSEAEAPTTSKEPSTSYGNMGDSIETLRSPPSSHPIFRSPSIVSTTHFADSSLRDGDPRLSNRSTPFDSPVSPSLPSRAGARPSMAAGATGLSLTSIASLPTAPDGSSTVDLPNPANLPRPPSFSQDTGHSGWSIGTNGPDLHGVGGQLSLDSLAPSLKSPPLAGRIPSPPSSPAALDSASAFAQRYPPPSPFPAYALDEPISTFDSPVQNGDSFPSPSAAPRPLAKPWRRGAFPVPQLSEEEKAARRALRKAGVSSEAGLSFEESKAGFRRKAWAQMQAFEQERLRIFEMLGDPVSERDVPVLNALAKLHLSTMLPSARETGVEYLLDSLQLNEAQPDMAHLLAFELENRDLDQAIHWHQLAVHYGPENPEHHVALGHALVRAGQVDAASHVFEGLSRGFPAEPYEAIGLYELARLYQDLDTPEDRSRAREAYEAALESLKTLRLVEPEFRFGARWDELDAVESAVLEGMQEVMEGRKSKTVSPFRSGPKSPLRKEQQAQSLQQAQYADLPFSPPLEPLHSPSLDPSLNEAVPRKGVSSPPRSPPKKHRRRVDPETARTLDVILSGLRRLSRSSDAASLAASTRALAEQIEATHAALEEIARGEAGRSDELRRSLEEVGRELGTLPERLVSTAKLVAARPPGVAAPPDSRDPLNAAMEMLERAKRLAQ